MGVMKIRIIVMITMTCMTQYVCGIARLVIFEARLLDDNKIMVRCVCNTQMKKVLSRQRLSHQASITSNWLAVDRGQVPVPRPGQCNTEVNATESSMNFIKRHSLLDRAVPNSQEAPLFVKTSMGERLTVIAVDPGVKSVDGQSDHDVIFVGTTSGRILKLVQPVGGTDNKAAAVLVESIQGRR
jgi:hypothetical protein